MRSDISKSKAPAMPTLGKGTECIKILLSQVSKDNYEPFVPMFFPVLGAHISGAEFQYPDNSWKEMTGMMANLVANSGDNKGQLSPVVEAICRDFRQHDKEEENKYQEWQRQENAKSKNQKGSLEPIIAYRFPPTDTTNAGFIMASGSSQEQSSHGCLSPDVLDSTLHPALGTAAGGGLRKELQDIHTPTGESYRRAVGRTMISEE